MAGTTTAAVPADPAAIRVMLGKIRAAAHGIAAKTLTNLLSRFRKELRKTGVIDPGYPGCAARHATWGPLMRAIADDKGLSNGLAAFCNWCAANDVVAGAVDDDVVQRFSSWLKHHTLCPKPRDVIRRTPQLWNAASNNIEAWPKRTLTLISFKAPAKRLQWAALPPSLLADTEAYCAMRAKPDPFDERENAPRRPLAPSTVQQQKTHIRLAASVLVEGGVPVEDLTSLAALVEPERLKTVLTHYHEATNRQPNAFANGIAITLIQVAYHYVDVSEEQLARLKWMARRLPAIPLELTAKNQALLRRFESDKLKANLFFLPERLIAEVTKGMAEGRVDFVKAQVAIAIEVQLGVALRPQNLSSLNWQRHFIEPDGSKGRLLLHIPKEELKSRREEFTVELPDQVARRTRWYRRHVLPHLNADPNGDLFVNRHGQLKSQETLTDQIIKTIKTYLGIDMTPHQFRHLAGSSYLDENPEDTETARALLGHAWTKTTRIYVGSSSRRASKAYNRFVFEQREALRLKRTRKRVSKPKKKKTS